MGKYLIAYAGTAFVFFFLDVIWLMFITKNFYKTEIGHLLSDSPNLMAAGIFYIVFIGGIVFFAVVAGIKSESLIVAASYGAVLGMLSYGTYEITNFATLNHWPLKVVVVDLVWGMFITSVSSVGGYLFFKLFYP